MKAKEKEKKIEKRKGKKKKEEKRKKVLLIPTCTWSFLEEKDLHEDIDGEEDELEDLGRRKLLILKTEKHS